MANTPISESLLLHCPHPALFLGKVSLSGAIRLFPHFGQKCRFVTYRVISIVLFCIESLRQVA